MKKLFILSFASILLLTGCGATETLSCSYRSDANNGSTKVTYDIDHEKEEIKKVRITYNYDFNDNTNNDENNNARVAGDNNTTNTTTDNNDTNTTTNNNVDNSGTDVANNTNNTTVTDNNIITNNNGVNEIDGIGTGTDGTTNDTQFDEDGIVDGIVGSAIDTIVGGVTSIILDSAGLRDRHANVQETYGNVSGFSVQNTNDTDNNYKVTYVIDYDTITDADLASFNLSRDLNDLRTNYVNQGFTCK